MEASVVQSDVIVAGCGPAGLLAAARLHALNPNLKITILEKAPLPGGRLKSVNPEQHIWGYGLASISPELYEFWNQTLKSNPEAPDLPSITGERQKTVGVLAAGRINDLEIEELFSDKGARLIAGAAAARDWKNFNSIIAKYGTEDESKDTAFHSAWNGSKQSPAAIALDHLAHSYGIADLWNSSTRALIERAKVTGARRFDGRWEKAFDLFQESLKSNPNLELVTNCFISKCTYADDQWTLATEQGIYSTPSLIVAQSPWDAIGWLPKEAWPEELLTMALKTKPTSVVVLSETQTGDKADLPDMIIVPAEDVQIIVSNTGAICYQATIDFEVSMQADIVVKAVRRLKRAKKKLHATMPNLQTEGDHLALLPVGWAQPTSFHDRHWLDKLEKRSFNSKALAFCGDAYGPSYDGDKNVIESLLSACGTMTGAELES